MSDTNIKFTFTNQQVNFNVNRQPVRFNVNTRQIHFQVGYACMNINTEIPGIPAGSTGLALVADENNQPAWGAPIDNSNQAIDGGNF